MENSDNSQLNLAQKKILLSTYNQYKDNGMETNQAMDEALYTMGSKDIIKSHIFSESVNMNTAMVKEGNFFSPKYYFDAILSSDSVDSHGQTVSASLLKYASDNFDIEYDGDINHSMLKGTDNVKGLLRMAKHTFKDNKLYLRFMVDSTHNFYKKFLQLHKKTPFTDLSAEFLAPKTMGNKIIFANKIGWTLTNKGSNPDSKIFARVRK